MAEHLKGGYEDRAQAARREQTIFFSGSIKLHVPDYTPTDDVKQLVQDELGHTGAVVEDIVEAH